MFLNSASISLFLSTPSARRATVALCHLVFSFGISIHALREEGDPNLQHLSIGFFISIHALREEGDGHLRKNPELQGHFYPRPPRGGRRHSVWYIIIIVCISIHALREEGDAE